MTTKSEVIDAIKKTLNEWALGDIYKALLLDPNERINPNTAVSTENAAIRGAFILGCSLIDAMSCYYFKHESSTEQFKQFCVDHDFMPGYNADGEPNDLYYSLRCGMLHNYLPKNVRGNTSTSYALTHDEPDKHLEKDENIVWINLQNFITDVHKALDKFFDAIDVEGDRRDNSFEWAKQHGWFGVTEIGTSGEIRAEAVEEDRFDSTSERAMDTITRSASSIVYYDGESD